MRKSLIVTSIAAPNKVLREFAKGCQERGHDFYLIGDAASPVDFRIEGCSFYDLDAQRNTGFRIAQLCPERVYSRKNVGYLLAARQSDIIVESDDDNFPYNSFWEPRERKFWSPVLKYSGWVNVYALFTNHRHIWPRGLPLDAISLAKEANLISEEIDSPIQQGLADGNPDVDAIHRLLYVEPFYFSPLKREVVTLAQDAWCPFNSQNTIWWKDAFPLLYLPTYCSFRMTDIWRSFVAQRIAWENGWKISYHAPTVIQERNEHDLMRDFRDEIPGYIHNRRIGEVLGNLSLKAGQEALAENLLLCYEVLIRHDWFPGVELSLVKAWLEDLWII